MVPLLGRSLRFEIGMFQHMTHTRDTATCRREAELARAAAATSHDDQQHLTHLAHAAWWAAVADRCRATAKQDDRAASHGR